MTNTVFDKSNFLVFLEDLDKVLDKPIDVYMIGGCAMTLRGYKETTLDVDLIVKDKKDFDTLYSALSRLKFSVDKTVHEERIYKSAVVVFLKKDSRVDVFIKSIVGMLDFTDTMIKRTDRYGKYNKLNLFLASNEDIFLLKSMSDRPKDIGDLEMLFRQNLDFKIILKECVTQHKKDVKWIFWLYESLLRLQKKYGISIPKQREFEKILKENEKHKPQDYPNI